MIGIAAGRSTKTNALSVYNPITKQYYTSDMYKFDPSCLPRTRFPAQIHYDGSLHANLYRHSHKNVPEPYPLSTPLKILGMDNDEYKCTTASMLSIPIHDDNGNVVPS